MRHRPKLDSNQPLIVKELRQLGASVTSLASVGSGVPDLLVGWQGKNFVFEVKDSTLPPSRRKLTPDEKDFHDSWRGQVSVIESTNDALRIMVDRLMPK